jgi:hypothetical protein
MSHHELLDPQSHRHLRVRQSGGITSNFVQIVVDEFVEAAASCPILFSKDAATGHFYAGALFGFKPGESHLKYIVDRGGFNPLNLQRDGFFIAGEHIAIDRNNARFSETDGELLFDEAHRPTVKLRYIQRVLGQLQAGTEMTDVFIRALADLRLIEPIDIALTFDGPEHMTLRGLYTVSLDALRDLDDAAALRLFRAGHLQLAYTMNASLKQIALLAQLRNQCIQRIQKENACGASPY